MKLFVTTIVLAAFVAAPAFAGDDKPAAKVRAKRDPNEIVCKVQGTAAGIPQRVCITRAEWEKASARTRSEFMMTQRPMCGIAGGGC